MSPIDLFINLLKERAGKWLSEAELLTIIPNQEKLDKEINALRASGWDITGRTIQAPTDVEGGVTIRLVTQYRYTPPRATKGWLCTRCSNVYTPVSGEAFGDSTIDPKHRQAACWRCKKKTFWRLIDEQASSDRED